MRHGNNTTWNINRLRQPLYDIEGKNLQLQNSDVDLFSFTV